MLLFSLVERGLDLEVGELLENLREGLAGLSGQIVPLGKVNGGVLGNTFLEDDTRIDEAAEHEEDVHLAIENELRRIAALVPAEHEEVVQDRVERALIAEHVVELVDEGHHRDEVLDRVRELHGIELVELGHVNVAEAVGVQRDGVVHVHAALNSGQEMVSQIKAETPLVHIDQIRDISPRVLVRSLHVVEAIPNRASMIIRVDVEVVIPGEGDRQARHYCENHFHC